MKNVHCKLIHRDFGLVFLPSEDISPSVIITVQHGGLARGVFEGLFTRQAVTQRSDLRTLELAVALYREIFPRAGIIHNMFHRDFLNPNVPPEQGPKDSALRTRWDSFHEEIGRCSSTAAQRHGDCLLLDIHGFVNQPEYAPKGGYDVILGTGNRKTIPHHASQAPENLLADFDYRLRDAFAAQGLSVFCPEQEPVQETRWRANVKKDHPAMKIVTRTEYMLEQVDETECVIIDGSPSYEYTAPPSLPDWYDGGYLVRRHSGRTVTAVQIETSSFLRESALAISEKGQQKRAGFVKALSSLVNTIYP